MAWALVGADRLRCRAGSRDLGVPGDLLPHVVHSLPQEDLQLRPFSEQRHVLGACLPMRGKHDLGVRDPNPSRSTPPAPYQPATLTNAGGGWGSRGPHFAPNRSFGEFAGVRARPCRCASTGPASRHESNPPPPSEKATAPRAVAGRRRGCAFAQPWAPTPGPSLDRPLPRVPGRRGSGLGVGAQVGARNGQSGSRPGRSAPGGGPHSRGQGTG